MGKTEPAHPSGCAVFMPRGSHGCAAFGAFEHKPERTRAPTTRYDHAATSQAGGGSSDG